ncbi:serine/threonine-protein kinase [Asanoa siamensis]|uniref:non-specific serine/threonine protein kinase n=1 Tax=Asanoa siamensis TaxID=926357 RepID=A0ABQ4CPW3_9ACTN|nr:serine/threonine-protein kinase [Asanoa siamensis]GIF73346.1 hypothetical protein Asi02nite_28640 [Asanoa siamensis]
MFESGLLVDDRYRLEAPIASGGMGQVWRATDTVLGRTVAVKLLHRFVDETARARFRDEARAMAALGHPGVAGVYDYGETAGADAYIVMACVEGRPLSQRIAEAGRLGAAETASVVAQAARALQAVHDAGVVHRDVKPGNLIVEPGGAVVLIDFGVAVTAGAPGHTGIHEVVGTALYMAPEQVTKQDLTPATDVYALGAVAYHCLAGRPPFESGSAVDVALSHLRDEPDPLPDDVPAGLAHVVETAMAKDPARRYPTAAALAEAVENNTTVETAPVVAAAVPAEVPPVEAPPVETPPVETPPVEERPAPGRRVRHAVGALALGVATLVASLALADPTGGTTPTTDRPAPPASTGGTRPAATGTDAGGAEPSTTGDSPTATPAPTGAPVDVGGPDPTPPSAPTGDPTPAPDQGQDQEQEPDDEPDPEPSATSEPTTEPDEPETPTEPVEPSGEPR